MPKTAKAPPAPSAPTPTQEAAAPAKIDIKPGQALRVVFEESSTKLPTGADAGLGQLAAAMRDSKEYRVQLMAYAGAKGLSTSKARRISLSRALAVRSYLIDKGVRSTQIDVRALGSKTSEKPANRVDINLARR
ncbi:MAG: OmpA family protein [Rhodospirillaceae bacterium]|nr:OmpA family protein [Rhodospirillaceae bacterium]